MTILDDPTDYTVGWIAALPIERAAATALLDDIHEPPKGFVQHQSDANSYTWGRMGHHNLVIASLPAGVYGITSAASTALNLLSSLPQIRIGLLVGIGGAIASPDQDWDIRLGDIVVSQPDGTTGGVIQYDIGKAKSNETWERKGSLNKPPPILLNALSSLQAQHEIEPSLVPNFLQAMWARNPQMVKPRNKLPAYIHQGFENDRLFKTIHDHTGGKTCAKCDASWEIERDQRDTTDPQIHYGIIASGNILIKDATTRDQIVKLVGEDCICFEMEAAGLIDRFPCLVIRGICDYADSHKNDQWQRYACATAAAYAKELLGYVPVYQLRASQWALDILGPINEGINRIQSATVHMQEEQRDIYQKQVLARLEDHVAAGASFDSRAEQHNSKCLSNTRVELLHQISEWAGDSSAKAVFWLNGMAGTGKSTVSRTVAESLAGESRLGASFFFKRGETDRGTMARFFPTIAADLTTRDPTIAPHVKDSIEDDSAIFRKAIGVQFDKLILQPLSKIQRKAPIVIVVDALDECNEEDDIKLMIHLFSQAKTLTTVQLKILLTSRPDLPVRLGFAAIEGKYQDLVLHNIPTSVVELDISVFLEYELAKIRGKFNGTVPDVRKLAGDWPGRSHVQNLAQMAIPLFIFAATVCRFIADRNLGTPDTQLKKVLKPRAGSHLSNLALTYLPVLDNMVSGRPAQQRDEILQRFRNIVGSIIILASPLSTPTLARILNLPRDDIDGLLDLLHSVLSIPSLIEEPVRLLHLSFRDFLLKRTEENGIFWVDKTQAHRSLASDCIRVMGCLQQDICQLKAPGTFRSAVDPQKINTHLPPELQYACLYWVYHIQDAGDQDGSCEEVYAFLKRYFLYWIEALSLMGRAWESLDFIKVLQSLYKDQDNKELSEFLDDAERFVLANISTIDEAPLQLYSSILAFTPEMSKVRTIFKDQLACWILLKPRVESNWSPILQTLEGHSDHVYSAVFSPDGTLIASASDDETVRLWRAATGECIRVFKGHSNGIFSVVFSPDGTLIASASEEQTTLWRIATGECIQIYDSGYSGIASVAFLPDGTPIASDYFNGTVRIWCIATGECIQVVENENQRSRISFIVFSPDGTLIASEHDDQTVQVRRTTTGECIQILKDRGMQVDSIVFSPNGTLIASVCDGMIVQVWQVATGECIQILQGNINLIAFSPNGTLLALASLDNTITLRGSTTGKCIQILKSCSTPVGSINFSPDGTLIALTTSDQTVRLWHTMRADTLEGDNGSIDLTVCSPDGTLVASASHRTIQIWCTTTGAFIQTIESHIAAINSITFSPHGNLIITASKDGTAQLWSVATGECVRILGHTYRHWPIVFSPDGALIVLTSKDLRVQLWSVATGKLVQILGYSYSIRSIIVFSPDGTLIALTSEHKNVRLWSVATGKLVQILSYSYSIRSIVFSPDGTLIALTSEHEMVRLWSVATGECVRILDHSDRLWSTVFSPDGALIASTSDDLRVRLWSVATGECLQNEYLGIVCSRLSFEHGTQRLLTDIGAISIRADNGDSSTQLDPSAMTISRPGLGISQDLCWVTWNGEKFFWLPADFRPTQGCSAIVGSSVMIGSNVGNFIVMRFSLSELAEM